MRKLHVVSLVALLLLVSSSLFAQATRTWVSGVGDDVNPCSRTAPCKTFAGAISKTAAGGEINALDSGGFGAVTITKSITIDAGPGVVGGILHSSTNGVVINAAGITVTLRNLDINGTGTTLGLSGIRIIQAGTVNVEDCQIYSYNDNGIVDVRTTAGKLVVKNTVIRGHGTGDYGIFINPSSVNVSHNVVIQNVIATGVTVGGLRVDGPSKVYVTDSNFSNNDQGIMLISGALGHIDRTTLAGNAHGMQIGSGSTARLANTMIVGNTTNGLLIVAGGTVESFGNNAIRGNGGNNGAGMVNVGTQ